MVTDTTQGDFTTHLTEGWILDHTVLRHREKKIDAITARTVTSITSVDLVKSHLLIAHWNIHYHNVSKQLQTQGGVQIDFQQSSH